MSLCRASHLESIIGSREEEGAKPPRRDCWRAMQPIVVFIWHISSEIWSRRLPIWAHMCWSWSKMVAKDASTPKEEGGTDEEEGQEA